MAFYQEIRYCIVSDPSLLGDGICHNFGLYNTAGCGFDGGDCDKFNAQYTRDGVNNCTAPYPVFLEDGKCDGGDVYSTTPPSVIMMVETVSILTCSTQIVPGLSCITKQWQMRCG